MSLVIKIVRGKSFEPYLSDLARLRIQIFRDYPYLYDGNFEYEMDYLKTYLASDSSILVLVINGEDKIVGASTGIPLTAETIEFQKPFLEKQEALENYFYCGESILLPEYRGRGIYPEFFKARENAARELGCQFTTFCAVERPVNNVARPANYRDLTDIWQRLDYVKQNDMRTQFEWKQTNEDQASLKTMIFWIKKLC